MVDIGPVRLACRVTGVEAAPALVLLHALGETGSTWARTAEALGGAYRVHAPDLRGHGDSDRSDEYSLELMRDDVLGLIDAFGLGRVTLVGHSMGAIVAYLLAGERPELIERLVLEEPAPPVPASPPRAVPRDRDENAPFDWAMVEAVYRQRNDPDPAYWDRLATITAPTLIVAGGSASPLPQDEMSRMAELIPDCRMVTIESGHLVHEARPAEFAAEVRAFLS